MWQILDVENTSTNPPGEGVFVLSRSCLLAGRGQSESTAATMVAIIDSSLKSGAIQIEASALSLDRAQGFTKCRDGTFQATCPATQSEESTDVMLIIAIVIASTMAAGIVNRA